jgi:hypothetical protein
LTTNGVPRLPRAHAARWIAPPLIVFECALAARARVIVSGDGDLRSLGTFQGIPILSQLDPGP